MEFEIWDAEVFQSLAVFETESAALGWVFQQVESRSLGAPFERFNLIASSDSADDVVTSGQALIAAAIRHGSIARTA
ncbi:MAG TPA: hypothetical protein PK691_12995 [Thermomicrobiales bacterium]|nr:hypothetical protein [Thermomicrobiales bacterium]HRA49087.1 hypothetical protein [Thermomicrobiales bacterium]